MSVAGLRPGFGRGGMTHSFRTVIPGVGWIAISLPGLRARVCGAGAMGAGAGEPAEEGVETAGDAMARS